jgi:hypothetical protein
MSTVLKELQGMEGFGMQERAAEQLGTHPVCPPDGSSDHQRSTRKPEDVVDRWAYQAQRRKKKK